MFKRACSLFLLVLLASILSLVQSMPSDSRIWGGEDVAAGAHPWAVSLRRNNAHRCTGSIISSTHIITAAHCVSQERTTPVPLSEVTLRVGSINQFAGGSIHNVKSIDIFPSYGNFLHNIAIVTTSTPIVFNDKTSTIDLPTVTEENDGELEEGTPLNVQGWGELLTGGAAYKLQNGVFSVLGRARCNLEAGYGYDSVLCLQRAEKQGVCRGDDGAPVVSADKKLVGTVSFYFAGCGSKFPDIASKTVYYLDWINSILNK